MAQELLDQRIREQAVTLTDEIACQTEGVVSKTIIDKPAGTLTLFAFDEAQGLSEHSAPFDAFVHLLEGEMEIRLDGSACHLLKGQSLMMPANVPHALRAQKPSKMMLVMIRQT